MSQSPSGRWVQHDQVGQDLYIRQQELKIMAFTLKEEAVRLKITVPPEVDSFFEKVIGKATLMRVQHEKKMESFYKKLDKIIPLEK